MKNKQYAAMISSTALDLPEHRKAVKEACLNAGVFPIGMEHLPARDASGIKVSLEMVDKADIYIGIYAWRYGWIPDGKDISITELEFDHAVKRKDENNLKEILIFTAHKEHPFTIEDVETENDAQKKLAAFKTRAIKGRVRKEFKSVEQLKGLVSDALHQFLQRENDIKDTKTSGATPRTSIPHNLPSLQPFFGREEELKRIADALDPDSRTWGAIIDGPGGMGKTSLAIRAAHNISPKVFEKIVFVSLKPRELEDDGEKYDPNFLITGLAELFNEMARELERDDITKAIESDRPKLLLDALRNTKTLLILDNLESLTKTERDTVFFFVKKLPLGCKAILTSRRRIGSGAEELILEKLSLEAALATLTKLAETNKTLAKTTEAERIELYNETAGKPLLLRWTAGQVGRGNCLTIRDAINYLKSCPEGNDPLEFIFGDLVNDFSEEETRALCALTYFTLPAKVEHIASIAKHTEAETELALKSLTNRSLVTPNEELITFTLVPLVADFLRVKKPEVLSETGKHLEDHAYTLSEQYGKNYDDFNVLDASWPTVAAALPRFFIGDLGRLLQMCTSLSNFLHFTGHWDELQAISLEAMQLAEKAGDFHNAGWRALDIGFVHCLRKQSSEVLHYADLCEAYWLKTEASINEKVTVFRLRGMGYQIGQNYSEATIAFQKAVDIARDYPESIHLGDALASLAGVQMHLENYDASERNYLEASRIAKSHHNDEGVALITGNLAAMAMKREKWKEAEGLARAALQQCEKLGRQELIASNNNRIADSLFHLGKKEEALPYAKRAVYIFQKLGSPSLTIAEQTLAQCLS